MPITVKMLRRVCMKGQLFRIICIELDFAPRLLFKVWLNFIKAFLHQCLLMIQESEVHGPGFSLLGRMDPQQRKSSESRHPIKNPPAGRISPYPLTLFRKPCIRRQIFWTSLFVTALLFFVISKKSKRKKKKNPLIPILFSKEF